MKRRSYLSGVIGTGLFGGTQIIQSSSTVTGSEVSVTPSSESYNYDMSDIDSLVITFEKYEFLLIR